MGSSFLIIGTILFTGSGGFSDCSGPAGSSNNFFLFLPLFFPVYGRGGSSVGFSSAVASESSFFPFIIYFFIINFSRNFNFSYSWFRFNYI